jgi:hypothetical protein
MQGDSAAEPDLSELASTPLEDLLARANPVLRCVLMRYYLADPTGSPTNGRFNAFIARDR